MADMASITETSGVDARSRTETPSGLNVQAGKSRTRLSTAERFEGTARKRSNASSESAEQKNEGSEEGKNIREVKTGWPSRMRSAMVSRSRTTQTRMPGVRRSSTKYRT